MWIFGRASKKEIKEIKKQGWEVSDVDVDHFDLCLDAESGADEDIPTKDKMIAVYVDNDMFNLLSRWHNEEKANEEIKRVKELQDLRMAMANKLWDEMDLKDFRINLVEDVGQWDVDGDRYILKFRCTLKGLDGKKYNGQSATFVVTFKPNSDMTVDAGNINC